MPDSSIKHLNALMKMTKQEKEFKKAYEANYAKATVRSDVCDCNKNIESVIKRMSLCSQKIGFTMTFAKMWHDEDPDTLYKYFQDYIKTNFESDAQYIIAPEFTTHGVMHFHGIMYNSYQRFVNKMFTDWRKQYGMIKMEYTITEHWENYITKDMDNIGYPVVTNLK